MKLAHKLELTRHLMAADHASSMLRMYVMQHQDDFTSPELETIQAAVTAIDSAVRKLQDTRGPINVA